LHVVTDDAVLARPGFASAARRVLGAGGAGVALHLRGPATSGGLLWRLAVELAPAAEAAGGWLIVNDRVDVAATSGAHGVQLGRRSLPVPEARGLLGPDARIGASVHDAAEADEAGAADWLVVGMLFPSVSHPGRAAAGVGLLARVREARALPLVAIGGVTRARVAEVRAAGAAGVAVLSGVWADDDPTAAAAGYLDLWNESPPDGEEAG
jgi:thiamine-phosphate diphosphorylase